MSKRKRRVPLTLDPSLYQRGQKLAAKERRSFSNWVEIQVEEKWEERRTGKKAEVAA